MIFVDTGAFIARYIERDQYHKQAVSFWVTLQERRCPCWTSNFVLDEVFTLLGRMAGNRFADDRAQAIYDSRALSILRPDFGVERAALSYFRKFSDQAVSYTDCTSFVLMKQHRIADAFTFDAHFRLAGFGVYPLDK